jgi:hypothetical protein
MIKNDLHLYLPADHETESASYSYLMSIIAIVMGLPLPIINLLATIIFYFLNRKSTYFVRWHCTQALVSQLFTFLINSYGFWWTISIIFTDEMITNQYIGYIIVQIIFNIIEFILTIYSAIKVRNGKHVHMLFFGFITNFLCKS